MKHLDTGSWMLPYGTLMMILMIFFVILYSFSQQSKDSIQYERTIASLESSSGGKKSEALKEVEIAALVEEIFKKEGMEDYVQIIIDPQKVHVILRHNIIFESGSINLKESVKKAISGLAAALKDMPNQIIVEGHTDSIPVGGAAFSSNWELSALRAFSVIKYLIDQENISPDRLTAYGYGPYRPVDTNETPEGRANNRRIEISIMRGG